LNCELCGKPIRGKGFRIMIMGAILTVCSECAKYGTPIYSQSKSRRRMGYVTPPPKTKSSRSRLMDEDVEIVEDYAERIRAAREALGWTKEILAERVKEKVSVIRRIESGAMIPPISLARKLESVLRIKLLEPTIHITPPKQSYKNFELTLGDIAEIKFKKRAKK